MPQPYFHGSKVLQGRRGRKDGAAPPRRNQEQHLLLNLEGPWRKLPIEYCVGPRQVEARCCLSFPVMDAFSWSVVLLGVDDEASLTLAAGAMINRINRAIYK